MTRRQEQRWVDKKEVENLFVLLLCIGAIFVVGILVFDAIPKINQYQDENLRLRSTDICRGQCLEEINIISNGEHFYFPVGRYQVMTINLDNEKEAQQSVEESCFACSGTVCTQLRDVVSNECLNPSDWCRHGTFYNNVKEYELPTSEEYCLDVCKEKEKGTVRECVEWEAGWVCSSEDCEEIACTCYSDEACAKYLRRDCLDWKISFDNVIGTNEVLADCQVFDSRESNDVLTCYYEGKIFLGNCLCWSDEECVEGD